MVTVRRVLAGVALLIASAGCQKPLPDADSPGGRLYAARCGNCHRAFQPGTLKYAMWVVQVDRKQSVMARAGMPPLSDQERTLVLDYLKRHSG